MVNAPRVSRAMDETGYAMAALLVAIGLMAVFMSAALPTWRQAARREKEAELLWRGRQYDRAVQLFRRRYGAPGPPSIEALVEGRFLRKKYLDPITGRDFELRSVTAMGTVPAEEDADPQSGTRRGLSRRRTRRETPTSPQRARGQLIGGVRSTSKERSIMVLNGRSRYNEWEFAYVPFQDRLGQPVPQNPNMPGLAPSGRDPRSRTRSQRSPSSSGRGSTPRTPRSPQ
jgi:type II secretory pathway pseudopilin PulG